MDNAPGESRGFKPPRWLGWIACAVVLVIVGIPLFKQLRQIPKADVQFDLRLVTLATICLLLVAGVQVIARHGLFRAYGQQLSLRRLLAVSWVPAIGKYMIGGIASVGGALVMLRRYGVPGAIAFSVTILLDALAVLAGFIVSAPLLLAPAVRERMPLAWVAGLILIVLGIISLHPRVFVALLNLILRRFGKQAVEAPRTAQYLVPMLASFGQWLFAGLSLWFMTDAVMEVSVKQMPLFIASSALAITVGYLTPFAPGGIGVREGLYLLTLGPLIGPKVAVVAVAMRVIQTILELVLALIGFVMLRNDASGDPDQSLISSE